MGKLTLRTEFEIIGSKETLTWPSEGAMFTLQGIVTECDFLIPRFVYNTSLKCHLCNFGLSDEAIFFFFY